MQVKVALCVETAGEQWLQVTADHPDISTDGLSEARGRSMGARQSAQLWALRSGAAYTAVPQADGEAWSQEKRGRGKPEESLNYTQHTLKQDTDFK